MKSQRKRMLERKPKPNKMDLEAFSSGQVISKLWLSQELEPIAKEYANPAKIVLVGGWYGLLNFILKARANISIECIRSIDVDADACAIADKINDTWVWQNWKFKSINADANQFNYDDYNIVINTSVEHIDTQEWFDRIPRGCLVALQSNDMDHEDHCRNHKSLEEFKNDFALSKLLYSGSRHFEYPEWGFNRFMIIGQK